ncbi:hypothetical protein J4G52_30970 [Burkholderia cenocepacia]|uniref:hypothetical protein n=1 Tax=Burkholderia cenocepacia TaxID=95486 RepID=UPI001AA17FB0|nr:hypothetical protein [Burkholderia cenocepacia]MBO1857978.1 hypothetical protein [Burkholderia cenocepacia]
MGKLAESTQWEEDLYQIEIADPVEGGPDGVSNKQAKQLGGRTRYLKTQLEQSQSSLAQHVAAADPHSQYALKTDLAAKLAALVGQSPQSLDTLKELADALGNDPNFATTVLNSLATKAPIDSPTFTGVPKGPTAPQFDNSTKLATTASVNARGVAPSGSFAVNSNQTISATQAGSVIYLVGAGGFTVTLPLCKNVPMQGGFIFSNLASTTVTLAVQSGDGLESGEALLTPGDSVWIVSDGSSFWHRVFHANMQSPSFSGQPTAPTPPQFDSSARLAPTDFVRRALGNFSGFTALNTNTTLTAAHAGQAIQWYGASGGVVTLPLGASMSPGSALTIFNFGTGPITVATQSTDFIWSAGSVQPVTLQVGDSLVVVSRGSTEWDIGGGTAAIQFTQVRGYTAPQFESNSKLATTLFVQRALGNFSGFWLVTSSTTLTAAAAGQLVEINGSAPFTTTLPVGSSVAQSGKMAFINQSGANQTITTQGADSIWSFGSGLVSSVVLRPGDSLELVSRAGQWDICGGSAMLQFSPITVAAAAASAHATQFGQTISAGVVTNVKASRAIGTTYSNSTGRPIFVTVSASVVNAGDAAVLVVNGIAVVGSSSPSNGPACSVFAVVPIGGTYSLSSSNNGAGGIAAISSWTEVR